VTPPSEVVKARNGAWTPWAAVLCVECEFADLKSTSHSEFYARRLQVVAALARTETVEQPDGDLLGICNNCQCTCWVRDDVALLQQVGFKASDLDWEGPFGWALQQTGGMCAALVFTADKREIVVTAMDGEFYVGEYVQPENEDEQCWDSALRMWKSEVFYVDGEMKSRDALTAMVEECARKAIEFIRQPVATAPKELTR
jgi:hypothetical protein